MKLLQRPFTIHFFRFFLDIIANPSFEQCALSNNAFDVSEAVMFLCVTRSLSRPSQHRPSSVWSNVSRVTVFPEHIIGLVTVANVHIRPRR
jgi:hypothetical protein